MVNKTREKGTPDTDGKRENGFGGRNGLLEKKLEAKKRYRNDMFLNAVVAGKMDTVKNLVSKGADVNAVDERGRSALRWANQMGHTEIAEYLKFRGAKEHPHN